MTSGGSHEESSQTMASIQLENVREEFEDKFHVQVLQQCLPKLVEDLHIDNILDHIGCKGIIHHVKIRDIREQTTTSEKTRKLIQYLVEGDEQSYHTFKECLVESNQSQLRISLEDVEKKTKANDHTYIDLTKDEELDSNVDLTCSQGADDASVIVISSLESDDPSTSNWDRSSNAKTDSDSQMISSKRPVNTISSLSKGSTVNKSNVPAAAAATTGSDGSSHSIKSSTPTMPTGGRVHSIASLIPYQNRWRIRARVTQKSNIRTWSNSRGEGKLFSVNLVDESGEIKATGFTDTVDKFFNLLEVNKVFYISRAALKTANKQYSNVKNDYEMTFNNDTCIEPCEDDVDLPSMTFSFVKINELEKIQPNGLVDVIGTLKQCGDVSTVIGKQSQREITKRELQLVDQSGMVVALTLWGKEAESFDGSGNPVLAIKGARVSDWGGRSLSVLASSQLIINPDIREAHLLRGWYDREGSNMDFAGFKSETGSGASGGGMNWKFFCQVKSENLGQGDKANYFTSKGTVIFLRKENCMYQACPTETCNRKVIDQGNGMFRCEKCNKSFPDFKWRMILWVNLADFSDNQWVTCFQESAETILGKTAAELGHLRESNEAAFDQVFQDALFKSCIIKLRAKVETYNDESRLKTVCTTANPINWQEHGRRLVDEINKMIDS
ncbi:hypothetical protein ACJMK2_011608 [Sinanodonta woodiana]|uniref:Replication protein A subunit n=1 Tax=Sinanodonta woodiana TaxID=1069815 RepID=A0ABD3V5J1_SINWO